MQNLPLIYGSVIDDVLSKVRSEFVQEGNEPVIEELRALWEEKLLQTGVLDTPAQEEPDEAVKEEARVLAAQGFLAPGSTYAQQQPLNAHNLSGPQLHNPQSIYANGQQYLQQQQQYPQQPLRNPSVPQGHAYQSRVSVAHPHVQYRMQQPANVILSQQGYGHPQPLQQPHSNIPDARKRKAEALQVPYGASAYGPPQKQERLMGSSYPHPHPQGPVMPQGIPQNMPRTAAAQAIPQQDGPGDDPAPTPEGEAASENLSDVEVEGDDLVDGKMLPDFILGQYELVKRIKNRWKCTLNHAVLHLNGQDVVVSKAIGEFTF